MQRYKCVKAGTTLLRDGQSYTIREVVGHEIDLEGMRSGHALWEMNELRGFLFSPTRFEAEEVTK